MYGYMGVWVWVHGYGYMGVMLYSSSAISQLTWNATGVDSQIFCLVARDMMGLHSLPLCVPVVVVVQGIMVSYVLQEEGEREVEGGREGKGGRRE